MSGLSLPWASCHHITHTHLINMSDHFDLPKSGYDSVTSSMMVEHSDLSDSTLAGDTKSVDKALEP